ncbi:MAG: type IV pilus modification protein PilV [Gammaproteobacteria bacterium]
MNLQRARGFSLVEVMVALVICAIGLLGIAKMESLALSSTGVASARSLAAIEASSMAAAMHANRAYWGNATAPATTLVDATANNYSSAAACTTAGVCNTAQKMALYDLQQWSLALQAVLPNFFATINCSITTLPVNCTITIQWAEAGVALNAQQTNMANLAVPTYTVFVEP